MTAEQIDLSGTFTMNHSFVERLERHLKESEFLLAKRLAEVAPLRVEDPSLPKLPLPEYNQNVTLVEGIGIFEKRLEALKGFEGKDSKIVKSLNSLFWNHLELLEGAVVELFLQVGQINFDDWNESLEFNVSKIQNVLMHHLKETEWAFDQVEELLNQHQLAEDKGSSFSFAKLKDKIVSSTFLDKALWTNTENSIRSLEEEHLKFKLRYQYFLDLKDQVILSKVILAKFIVLYRLEIEQQQKYIKLFELLKFYSLNVDAKAMPDPEPVMAIRRLMSPEKAFALFKDYYQHLYRFLFEKARAIKSFNGEWIADESKTSILLDVKRERQELLTLAATLESYRDFLQKTDPNPYVRSKLGMSDWAFAGGFSKYAHLSKFGYDLKTLDLYYAQLEKSIANPSKTSVAHLEYCHSEVLMVLHQMGQPLLSKKAMELKANRFVSLLKEMNELGSFNEKSVDYAAEWISKALKADWRYHLLHGNSEFHQLFAIHKGLSETIDDRLHYGRMNKFKRIIHELEEWIKQNDTLKHARDIELDLNDIKGYLQDFYAQVQRAFGKPAENVGHVLQQTDVFAAELLDYRYLFGQFFYHLHEERTEERLMRDQLLFVDQYFEAVEQKLAEIRSELSHRE